jgi:hypothetical protein
MGTASKAIAPDMQSLAGYGGAFAPRISAGTEVVGMIPRRTIAVLSAIAALLVLMATPAVAQDESASPEVSSGPVIEVTAQDYHFEGLPTSVPAGTSLTLRNAGAEVHELLVVRRNDGVTESFDELLALPEEESLQKVMVVGILFAAPGESAAMGMDATGAPSPMTTLALAQEGDYLAICFIPQGTTELPDFSAQAAAPPSAAPAASAAPQGPPHFLLGMKQEFSVTAAGSEIGPIPSGAPAAAMPTESPAA